MIKTAQQGLIVENILPFFVWEALFQNNDNNNKWQKNL